MVNNGENEIKIYTFSKDTFYKREKKVGVARLKPTRDDNSKGPRIGPSLFYTSELHTKYIKYFFLNLDFNFGYSQIDVFYLLL